MECCFKLLEGPHLPALYPADECKCPGSAVGIAPVQHRQPLFPTEAGVMKRPDQGSQLRGREQRPVRNWHRPQVQQGPVKTPLSTRQRQGLKGFLARLEIELFIGVETNELIRLNNL